MKIHNDRHDVSVWLAKLPPFLSEKLQTINGEQTIGEIWIQPATSSAPTQIQFKLGKELIESGLPSEYTLTTVEKSDKLYLLKEVKSDMVVEGYINREIFINPVQSDQYFEFLRERALMQKKASTTKLISYVREGKQSEKFGSVSELDYLARKRKRMLQAKKRERLEKNEVIDILFRAFEKHPAWSVRDLADFSGQPVAFIQEIIPEICVLNKKDYKNLYELKPEYRADL